MKPKRPRHTYVRKAAVAEGYRSGLEKGIADDLKAKGIEFEYEQRKISYVRPVRGGSCGNCGSKVVGKRHVYTPDFELKGSGIIVEAKGRFTSSDRTKLAAIKAQYPELKLRLLFAADNKLSKSSRTRYSEWATKAGFRYHVGRTVPDEWVK